MASSCSHEGGPRVSTRRCAARFARGFMRHCTAPCPGGFMRHCAARCARVFMRHCAARLARGVRRQASLPISMTGGRRTNAESGAGPHGSPGLQGTNVSRPVIGPRGSRRESQWPPPGHTRVGPGSALAAPRLVSPGDSCVLASGGSPSALSLPLIGARQSYKGLGSSLYFTDRRDTTRSFTGQKAHTVLPPALRCHSPRRVAQLSRVSLPSLRYRQCSAPSCPIGSPT
jgi:hypothetical protein